MLLVLPVGLVCLAPPVLTRLVGTDAPAAAARAAGPAVDARGIGRAVGWALVMWAAYGVHLWLLVRPQETSGRADLLLLATGGYALAWTAGFLFVIAPAGAGVRELALVAALAPVLDRPSALAVTVLSRAVMTVGDLGWGAVGAALRPTLSAKGGSGHGGAGVTTVSVVQRPGEAADA